MTTATSKLVNTRSIITVTLIVAVVTIISVWLLGLGQHRTIFVNSLLSARILSLAFFIFLATGLYSGIKLKDNVGKITDKLTFSKTPDLSDSSIVPELEIAGDGIGGIIAGILLWAIASVLIIVFMWFFSAVLWTGIIAFMGMMYWIFFRALRLVFKNSGRCKGNISKSAVIAITYTFAYTCWVYGIILALHYMIK